MRVSVPRLIAGQSDETETITHQETIEGTDDFEKDLELVAKKLSNAEPRYILFQHGPKQCAFIMFVPDHAKVRAKMLYASSSSTLQRQLGGAGCFSRQVFWTELGEVSAKGWRDHLAHEKLSAPLTEEERSLQDVREKEVDQMLGTGARKSHVNFVNGGSHVQIKLADEAKAALEQLASEAGVVAIAMDMASETLVLAKAEHGPVSRAALLQEISASSPQYTIYKPSADAEATFIYTCPSGSKVKERMVYAVNRKSVAKIAQDSGVAIGREVEGTNAADVADDVDEGASPAAAEKLVSKPRFNRPKAPGRR